MAFHERQRLMLCGVHALNNLFCNEAPAARTTPLFSKASLDSIAEEQHRSSREIGISGIFNPHRSIFGLGNYDVVVMEKAVTHQGCTWKWVDSRRPASAINLAEPGLVGLILNSPRVHLLGIYKSRHWYTIRWCGQDLLNLDSNLESPEVFSCEAAAHHHLQAVMDRGGHVFLVRSRREGEDDEAMPQA